MIQFELKKQIKKSTAIGRLCIVNLSWRQRIREHFWKHFDLAFGSHEVGEFVPIIYCRWCHDFKKKKLMKTFWTLPNQQWQHCRLSTNPGKMGEPYAFTKHPSCAPSRKLAVRKVSPFPHFHHQILARDSQRFTRSCLRGHVGTQTHQLQQSTDSDLFILLLFLPRRQNRRLDFGANWLGSFWSLRRPCRLPRQQSTQRRQKKKERVNKGFGGIQDIPQLLGSAVDLAGVRRRTPARRAKQT